MRDFKAVEHRLEFVATIRGVDYYNDSKATNVDATIKALESFPANIHLDSRRQGQGQRLQRAQRSAAPAGEARIHHRRGGGEDRVADSGRAEVVHAETWRMLCARPMASLSRAMWCCWLRPAPASISSRTMSTAGRCSKRSCENWRQRRASLSASRSLSILTEAKNLCILLDRGST